MPGPQTHRHQLGVFNLKIQQLPIDKIIPYVQNPKSHPEGQVKKLASAIAEFKWDQPIVVDKDMVIIKGHGRLLAAQALGLKTVPVVIADYLTPAQAKAARLADNRVAESEWFPETLALELKALEEMEFDLSLTGFEDFERDELADMEGKTALGEPGQTTSRNLGKGQVRVKPVLAVEDVTTFEKAIKATGEINRGKAIIKICEAYLGGQEQAKGQFDAEFESIFKA